MKFIDINNFGFIGNFDLIKNLDFIRSFDFIKNFIKNHFIVKQANLTTKQNFTLIIFHQPKQHLTELESIQIFIVALCHFYFTINPFMLIYFNKVDFFLYILINIYFFNKNRLLQNYFGFAKSGLTINEIDFKT